MRHWRFLILFVGVLSFSACTTAGPLVDGVGGAPGRFVVKNESNKAVSDLRLSRCGGFDAGPNRLTSDESIPPQTEKAFVLSPGCWDVDLGGGGQVTAGKFSIVSGQDYVLNFK